MVGVLGGRRCGYSVRRRDQEADAYVRSALPSLMGLAMAMTRQRADAEDLVQETLATVVARWGRVSAADEIDAYVRRILVNTFLSRARRRSASEIVTDEVRPTSPANPDDEPAQLAGSRDLVVGLLRTLTARQRAVLALRYYEDLADVDIAAVLDCTEQAVRSAAHAALRALRATVPDVTALTHMKGAH